MIDEYKLLEFMKKHIQLIEWNEGVFEDYISLSVLKLWLFENGQPIKEIIKQIVNDTVSAYWDNSESSIGLFGDNWIQTEMDKILESGK